MWAKLSDTVIGRFNRMSSWKQEDEVTYLFLIRSCVQLGIVMGLWIAFVIMLIMK